MHLLVHYFELQASMEDYAFVKVKYIENGTNVNKKIAHC